MSVMTSMRELDRLIAAGCGSIPRAEVPPSTPEEIEAELARQRQDKIDSARVRAANCQLYFTPDEHRRMRIALERDRKRQRPENLDKPVRPSVYARVDREGRRYYIVIKARKKLPGRFKTVAEAEQARDRSAGTRGTKV